RGACVAARPMNTGSVPEIFREGRLHRIARGVAKRCSRVVVQVDHQPRNLNPLDKMRQNVLRCSAMKMPAPFFVSLSIFALPVCVFADSSTHNPTWWDKS